MLKSSQPVGVLIIVQNLSVPLDRRVWLECNALMGAGYDVTVICPRGPGEKAFEVLEGVTIFRYRPAPEARGIVGYLWEFGYSWLQTARLSVVAWRRRRFEIIQACNPPDTYWMLAKLWSRKGVRFVYDQHDLNPELFISRFGVPRSLRAKLQLAILKWLERRTYASADHVIVTNSSYGRIAMTRGARDPSEVSVVRSGPDTAAMRPIYPDVDVKRGAQVLLVYLGIMGPQDNVDVVLTVMHELVYKRNRTGVRLAVLGFGDCLEALKQMSTELGLDACVEFTGRVGSGQIAQYLSGADIGLQPDRHSPLNDVSTMNKTMEFMAYALPAVAFDLTETRSTTEGAALLVPSGDVSAFVDAVELLIDDQELRVRMGTAARARAVEVLDWRPQARAYIGAYDVLSGKNSRSLDPIRTPITSVHKDVRWVDDDAAGLGDFIRRGRPSMVTGTAEASTRA